MKSFAFLLLATSLFSVEQVRVQPVSRTPEADTVKLIIAVPREAQVIRSNPVYVQIRVDGFSLGSDSGMFDRADELALTDLGQTIHVVVDNEPYFPVNEPPLDPFIEQGFYYDTSYKFEIPKRLSRGIHTLRMFPARSYGEGLKGENTFAVMTFYVGGEEGKAPDLSKPYLTYNEPSNRMDLRADKPILLDFYVSNCALTNDGYKVRLSIDGKVTRMLPLWVPYYIYGMPKGRHTVRLELVDKADKLVDGPFSDVQETIVVH